MAVNLTKGGRISLNKEAPGLKKDFNRTWLGYKRKRYWG